MESCRIALFVFATIMLTTFVSARAVNISNTWMLPEEGFPVFYRYFRDRISWYEADAVCQFHHANLVTADTTSQYDAIRAYLKELDISEDIWIGLSKTTERPNFAWTNYSPLSGDGHWQQPLPKGNDPLCVAMDPAADFLWKPMSCGGPEVASFICELPVPSWAMGPKGCLLTELPSLTVLYIPEQLALELTSDCGLDGTKRISCQGQADREELLKQLTCAISDDFEDKSTKTPPNTVSEDLSSGSKTTKPWIWTSNTIDIDYGMPTRHRRETEDTLSPTSTKSTTDLSTASDKNKLTVTLSNWDGDVETTSFSPEKDVTLDSSVARKSMELKTTQVYNLSTQDVDSQTEKLAALAGDTLITPESKTLDSDMEDTAEYPSAIGQGQLFSIIENGTMFDIIEVNDTTSDDLKLTKDGTTQMDTEIANLTKPTTDGSINSHTTAVSHTNDNEPPSEATFVTNKSIKKADRHPKKLTLKEKDPKKITNQKSLVDEHNSNSFENSKQSDKTLSKEVETFPIMTDSLIKLNRTHRKNLPNEENPTFNSTNIDKHHHIEIKWDKGTDENMMQVKLFVTTKRSEPTPATKENIEILDSNENDKETFPKIDSKLDLLNNNNITVNNESEIFVALKPEKIEEERMKTQLLPKSLSVETKIATTGTPEPLEPEPQAQPRPNRQRQLTRPQRRSFYPYFFSRVLG